MARVETSGSDLNEAKQNAMKLLGASDENAVVIEVIAEGEDGVLVQAELKQGFHGDADHESHNYELDDETAKQIADYVQDLLNQSPLQVQVVLKGWHARYADVEIVGRDVPYLVGKNGEVIDNLQYLLNMIISRRVHPYARLVLDGGGWRKRREEKLRNQVMVIALEVQQRGEEAVLPVMPAHERRLIHNILKENPDVSTYSEGEEPNRRVVISPKKREDTNNEE